MHRKLGTGYLRDETGNRRYWPVACAAGWEPGRKADTTALAAVRDQLWAEAVVRLEQGEAHWFTNAEVEASQVQAVEARFAQDVWADAIHAFIAGRSDVSVAEVLEGCLGKPRGSWQQWDQMRVGAVLAAAKWDRRRPRAGDGKREWRYFNPDAQVGPTSEPSGPTSESEVGPAETSAKSKPGPTGPTGPTCSTKWETESSDAPIGFMETGGPVDRVDQVGSHPRTGAAGVAAPAASEDDAELVAVLAALPAGERAAMATLFGVSL